MIVNTHMTRRELLGATLAAPAALARRTMDRSRISAITDEIGNTTAEAIEFARQYGLKWIELRGSRDKKKEYAFLPEPELKAEAAAFARNGLKVSFLNTSLMKFTWPGTEAVRRRPETGEARTRRLALEAKKFENRIEDLKKAINAAHIFGVKHIRVFAGMRVADPQALMPRIVDVLGEMAFVAEKQKVQLLLENEGACNVGTSAELAEAMRQLPSKGIGINWDPQNGLGHKEVPFPDGYNLLPKKRVGNVQIKGKGVMPESDQKLDWKAIMAAFSKDGYKGKFGLETHIFDGTLIPSSHISIKEIYRIVDEL
jgi:sugar phosphate isomerase/epimerase